MSDLHPWTETRICPWCREPWLAYGRGYARMFGLKRHEASKRYCSLKCSNAAKGIQFGEQHFKRMTKRSVEVRRKRVRSDDYRAGFNAGWLAGKKRGLIVGRRRRQEAAA